MTAEEDEIRLKDLLDIYSKEQYKEIIEILNRDQKRYYKEQLAIHVVSQQRELLENFADWMDKNINFDGIRQEEIDSYITEKIL